MSRYPDSLHKIVKYFAATTEEEFTFNGYRFIPHPLHVSPSVVRDVKCPPDCGACCSKFSLDYLPSERHPEGVAPRATEPFNGEQIVIYSDLQRHQDHFCRHVNPVDGRCGIYPRRPFTCDFELIRFRMSQDLSRPH